MSPPLRNPRAVGTRRRRVSVARASADRRTSVRLERSIAAELALVRLAEAATAGRTSQQVLELVTEAAVTLAGAATVHIWLVRSESRELQLAAASGARPGQKDFQPQTALNADEGLVGRIAQSREPLVVISLRHEPHLVNLAWARDQGFVSFRGGPAGARGAASRCARPLHLAPPPVRAARGESPECLCSPCRGGSGRRTAHAEAQAHEREVTGLADASRQFSAMLRREEILTALVEAAAHLMPARWSVLTIDPNTREVQPALIAHSDSGLARTARGVEPALIGVSEVVATTSTLLHVRTLDAPPDWTRRASPSRTAQCAVRGARAGGTAGHASCGSRHVCVR